MRNAGIPHYFNIFPTGDIPVPVCIGDLPLSDYIVSGGVMTEDVARYLDDNSNVPGAILMDDGYLSGVIPRHKMFERLGRRYGVELFLRKPVSEMRREIGAETFTLKSHLSINMAVRMALSRTQTHIYDPVIVEFEDHSLRLLDMYILLLSQSQLSNNLSGIVSSLNSIEMILGSESADPKSTLDLILESMRGVVPAHHVRIIVKNPLEAEILNMHEVIQQNPTALERNSIYRSVLQMSQPVVLEDTRIVPAWEQTDSPRNTRSWMGLPVSNQNGTLGLLSLARTTFSPFTNNEKEIAQVFARYIGNLFFSLRNRMERIRSMERKYNVI